MASKIAYHGVVINASGAGIEATVSVYTPGTSTLSTLYSDISGTAQANPLTTDANGRFVFYADSGEYDISASGVGIIPYILSNVSIIGQVSRFVTSEPIAGEYHVKKLRLDAAKQVLITYDGMPES